MVWTLTRVHYDQEAAGGRQTWRVCRRCLLRGPLPALFVYSLPFTAKSLLLWNIFHADVDYQSLFCANFTLRDIVWGNVDETRRLCLFAYNVIRVDCEGWSDLWSIVKEYITITRLANILNNKYIIICWENKFTQVYLKKKFIVFLIFIEFCLRYLVFQIVFSEETWIKRCTRIGTRSLNNLKVIKF